MKIHSFNRQDLDPLSNLIKRQGIPQCTILSQKCAHMCIFLLQNDALLDMILVHCRIYARGQIITRSSNCIFILNLTPSFNASGEKNCKRIQETFELWDLVRLILEVLRYYYLRAWYTWLKHHWLISRYSLGHSPETFSIVNITCPSQNYICVEIYHWPG